MTNEDREALAGTVRAELACGTAWYIPTGDSIADALLPVVDAIARRRAAEELRAAADALESESEQPRLNHMADTIYRPGDCLSSIWLRDRADALTRHEEAL